MKITCTREVGVELGTFNIPSREIETTRLYSVNIRDYNQKKVSDLVSEPHGRYRKLRPFNIN